MSGTRSASRPSGLLEAATSWLVEPAPEHPGLAAAPRPSEPRLELVAHPHATTLPLSRPAVIGTPAAVPPLAAAVALACRARGKVAAALVATWPAGGDTSPQHRAGPALPGAAAFAARLHRRDLSAVARGRLVWLTLPLDAATAVATLRHAEAAAGELPTVLAVTRPRDAEADALLEDRDLIVLAAPPDSPLARLAHDDLAGLGVPIQACTPQPPGAARLATLAGLRAPRLDAMPSPSGARA